MSAVPVFKIRDKVSALTHFTALVAAIFAMPALLIHAAANGADKTALISLSVFMLSMVFLYAASTAYHSFQLSPMGCRRLKKLDHIMIFYLIAGTYTPVCIIALGNMWLLALVWALALVGTVFKLCWVTCPKWVSSVIYIAMGWSCLSAMPQILATLSRVGFLWLLVGGLAYTVGGVIYAIKPKSLRKRLFGPHEIFHIFVMTGSLCHYVFMYFHIV